MVFQQEAAKSLMSSKLEKLDTSFSQLLGFRFFSRIA